MVSTASKNTVESLIIQLYIIRLVDFFSTFFHYFKLVFFFKFPFVLYQTTSMLQLDLLTCSDYRGSAVIIFIIQPQESKVTRLLSATQDKYDYPRNMSEKKIKV